MAKKRRKRAPDHVPDEAGRFDPLGPLIDRYQVSLAGVLIVAAVVALVGFGLVAFALTRERISLLLLLIGAGIVLLAGGLVAANLFNLGRRLELRKKGIRFVDPLYELEFFWAEIADVRVNRQDETDYGVATVHKKGAHYMTPSGAFTHTEWDVTIQSHDGRAMHLTWSFLKIVPDPRKLISQIKLRAGM